MFSEKNILQFHLPKLEKSVARKKVHQGVKGIMYCKIHMYPFFASHYWTLMENSLHPSYLFFLSFVMTKYVVLAMRWENMCGALVEVGQVEEKVFGIKW